MIETQMCPIVIKIQYIDIVKHKRTHNKQCIWLFYVTQPNLSFIIREDSASLTHYYREINKLITSLSFFFK